ncbi:hypothetical protein CGZ95_10115 [Enemella evansiae]|nr:SRPBCC family protein [Enemella evansiae]OYN99970.1 hypothetical protein CGZ95_10115 [Enemella evansiae]
MGSVHPPATVPGRRAGRRQGRTHPDRLPARAVDDQRIRVLSPTAERGDDDAPGPWFFRTFGGGWRFTPTEDGRTRAVWKYTFTVRPDWLRPIAEPIGIRLLGSDIRRRIDAFARACADPEIVAAATEGPG